MFDVRCSMFDVQHLGPRKLSLRSSLVSAGTMSVSENNNSSTEDIEGVDAEEALL